MFENLLAVLPLLLYYVWWFIALCSPLFLIGALCRRGYFNASNRIETLRLGRAVHQAFHRQPGEVHKFQLQVCTKLLPALLQMPDAQARWYFDDTSGETRRRFAGGDPDPTLLSIAIGHLNDLDFTAPGNDGTAFAAISHLAAISLSARAALTGNEFEARSTQLEEVAQCAARCLNSFNGVYAVHIARGAPLESVADLCELIDNNEPQEPPPVGAQIANVYSLYVEIAGEATPARVTTQTQIDARPVLMFAVRWLAPAREAISQRPLRASLLLAGPAACIAFLVYAFFSL